MLGKLWNAIPASLRFYISHTGIHAVYAGGGAALAYISIHFGADAAGAGIDPTLATLIGGFLGTLASRVQAKNAPASAANPPA